MTIQIFLIFLVIILLAYIVFLHIQLTKKNIFIESTVKRLSDSEKKWSKNEIMNFLQEIQKFKYYRSFFNEKLFEDKNLEFFFENEKDQKIYFHYTKDEADAKSILSNGFRFVDSFYKTAMPVTSDKLDLIIKHNNKKYFGNYLIIIAISNKIVDYYSSWLEKAESRNYFIENILTETPPYRDDNSDLVYLLPSSFVKGYINHKTGEIVKNPVFNPSYDSPYFKKNIESLKPGEIHL
jgi:hypothetical protein